MGQAGDARYEDQGPTDASQARRNGPVNDMRVRNLALFAAAAGLVVAMPAISRADTRIFSVQTDRPGITITAVQRNGQALPEAGQSGARTFFQINAGSETVPCSNQLAFTASNGQRLEFIVDLCAHNWQVTLPLGTAQAPPPSTPSTQPVPLARLTIYTDDPNVGIQEVNIDKKPMAIGTRQGNAVVIALPPGTGLKCERDLGLALTDGRRIARMVNICVPNGAIVVALNSEAGTPVPPPVVSQPPVAGPPFGAPPPAVPPVVSVPPAAPPPGAGPEVIEGLKWSFGGDGNRASLAYALPESDHVEFFASCNRGSKQIDIGLDRSAPEVREGASVPVTLTAGTFAKTYTATGSEISAMSGLSHPELTTTTDDPLWPALIRGDYLVIQTGSAPAYALSLKGSSATAKPFLAACSPQVAAVPPPPPGFPAPPAPGGQVGGDYSCAEEGTLVSQRTEIQSRLIFRNGLSQPVQLFWLDYDGRRRPYLSLGPGETGVQPTFFTHPWVVADQGGRCLAIYYARRTDSEVVIGQ